MAFGDPGVLGGERVGLGDRKGSLSRGLGGFDRVVDVQVVNVVLELFAACFGPFEDVLELAAVEPDAVRLAPVDNDAAAFAVVDLVHELMANGAANIVTLSFDTGSGLIEPVDGIPIDFEDVFDGILHEVGKLAGVKEQTVALVAALDVDGLLDFGGDGAQWNVAARTGALRGLIRFGPAANASQIHAIAGMAIVADERIFRKRGAAV